MIPNVVRGRRTAGLMAYLVGPGRRNEHTEPHLVAGDAPAMAWYDDAELSRDRALRVAAYLERPKALFHPEMTGAHVWHCSLSLPPEEQARTDQEWGDIANRFMEEMGFTDAAGVKAAVRWIGLHHGASSGGNDHIHLVANIVREDGTKVNVHKDADRAQKAARVIEKEFGLIEVSGPASGRSGAGVKAGEREAEARRRARARWEYLLKQGRESRPWVQLDATDRTRLVEEQMGRETARLRLAREVRACAGAAASEADFVRVMRREGMLVRPRFADGRDDVVSGFSVALRPEHGERPIWFGGGLLGRDLSLPRLRERWEDTPEGATEAAAEWRRASRGRRPTRDAKSDVGSREWQRAADELGALRDRLRSTPIEDHAAWASAAEQAAAAFGAWSMRVEPTGGPLADAARTLGRSAQLRRSPAPRGSSADEWSSGAPLLLLSLAYGGRGTVAQTILLRQMVATARAIYDMHKAEGDLRQATALADVITERVVRVYRRLPQEAPMPGARSRRDDAGGHPTRARAGQTAGAGRREGSRAEARVVSSLRPTERRVDEEQARTTGLGR